jgi:nitrogen fixation/metabolism regulation signal transduction histidine kinase
MADVLKGNFKVKRPVEASDEKKIDTLTDEFERQLLAKLGGSACYVKDKPFIGRPKNS